MSLSKKISPEDVMAFLVTGLSVCLVIVVAAGTVRLVIELFK